MSIKQRVGGVILAMMLTLGALFAVPQAASAANESVNMNLVCQQNYGNTSWRAKLVNSGSVYGWKCWNGAYPEQYWLGPFFSADVSYFCSVVYGRYSISNAAYFTNVNDPYSWRCR